MGFVDQRKKQLNIKSLAEKVKSGEVSTDPTYSLKKLRNVNGPDYVDCLERKWAKGDVIGIIAGPGVGKTSFILNIFKSVLTNNPEGIVCFVSLEMTAQEIADKWFKLTHSAPELSERLFIVENYDDNDKCKHLTVNGIKQELSLIKNSLNADLLAVAVDHLHEVNNEGSDNFNNVMSEMKNLSIEMDTVTFVLSQTTKAKGIGDIPIAKDGCYNCSRFEWISSYVITMCQPLKRVQDQCEFPVLAFQYAKIRFKNRKDKLKEGMNYLLYFDFDDESLRPLTNAEKSEFQLWYDAVMEIRDAEEDRKDYQFDVTQEIKGKDGKIVKLKSTVGGRSSDDIDDF